MPSLQAEAFQPGRRVEMSSKVAGVAVPHDPPNELARTRTDEQCRTMDWAENCYDTNFF